MKFISLVLLKVFFVIVSKLSMSLFTPAWRTWTEAELLLHVLKFTTVHFSERVRSRNNYFLPVTKDHYCAGTDLTWIVKLPMRVWNSKSVRDNSWEKPKRKNKTSPYRIPPSPYRWYFLPNTQIPDMQKKLPSSSKCKKYITLLPDCQKIPSS